MKTPLRNRPGSERVESEPANSPRIEHIPALDGIRGAAVLAVLLFHAEYLQGGWLGVDLFFVLSGFLITTLLLIEWTKSGQILLSGFWTRRALRLLPALFVLLGVLAFVSFRMDAGAAQTRLRSDAIATLVYVANWHAMQDFRDYWAIFGSRSPLEHTWSLAIEEQFYVVWPLLAAGLFKLTGGANRRLSVLLTVMAFLAASGTIVSSYLGAPSNRIYFGTDTRAAAILFGCALAAWLREFDPAQPSRSANVVLQIMGGLALAGLVVAWITVDGRGSLPYRGGLAVTELLGVALILCAVRSDGGPVTALLSTRPLTFLGLISYGLYLWHWPIYTWLTPEVSSLDGIALAAVRIAVSIAVAIVSFATIERPIRRMFPQPRVAFATASAAAAVLAVLLLAPDWQRNVVAATATGHRRVVVFGDSVVFELTHELETHRSDMQVKSAAVPMCGVIHTNATRDPMGRVYDTSICEGLQMKTWTDTIEKYNPSLVVFIEGWRGLGERSIDGEWRKPCDPAYLARFSQDLASAIRLFGSRGAKVAIATVANADVNGTLWLDPLLKDELIRQDRMHLGCLNKARVQVARSLGAEVFDLDAFICPNGQCMDKFDDGTAVRPDGIHFTGRGGPYAAEWILNKCDEVLNRMGKTAE